MPIISAIVITVPRHRCMISQKFNRAGRGECSYSPSSGANGKEHAMSEDEIMEVKYISGIQPFMHPEGEPFWPFRGLSAL